METDNVTGITDETYGLKIYPNPFSNFITLENLESSPYTLQLIASTGHIAVNISIGEINSTWRIDTRGLAAGNYTLTLKAAGKIIKKQKLVKI